jgi:hypothetical protein
MLLEDSLICKSVMKAKRIFSWAFTEAEETARRPRRRIDFITICKLFIMN